MKYKQPPPGFEFGLLNPFPQMLTIIPQGFLKYVSQINLCFLSICQWPGDLGSIPGPVIPKTQKMVLDTSLLNTQHYKVWIKSKVDLYWERSCSPPLWCSSY